MAVGTDTAALSLCTRPRSLVTPARRTSPSPNPSPRPAVGRPGQPRLACLSGVCRVRVGTGVQQGRAPHLTGAAALTTSSGSAAERAGSNNTIVPVARAADVCAPVDCTSALGRSLVYAYCESLLCLRRLGCKRPPDVEGALQRLRPASSPARLLLGNVCPGDPLTTPTGGR
jgi:hypothetical protein